MAEEIDIDDTDANAEGRGAHAKRNGYVPEHRAELVGGGVALSYANGVVEIDSPHLAMPYQIGTIERAGSKWRASKYLGGAAGNVRRVATVDTSRRAFERLIHACGKKIRREKKS